MKKELISFLKLDEDLKNIDLDKLLQIPKLVSQGDLSLPMFIIAKDKKTNPNFIAKEFEEKLNLRKVDFIDKIKAEGPFLNFYFKAELIIKKTLNSIKDNSIFDIKNDNKQKILIEFPSPNTNKSLHIGHVRNMLLGSSLYRLLVKTKNEVIKTSVNNDRGIAICKSMLSYKLFSDGATPESMNLKPDEFVSYFYVLYGQKNKEFPELELDKKAQEMLVLWEKSDPETIKLWEKLLNYVYKGYEKTYENFKIGNFDKVYFESKIFKNGKDIVLNALKNKIDGFEKEDDGAVVFDFKDKTYGKKYLLRTDLTTLYMTQDLYLATLKEKDFHCDKYIFIVGKEQKYHFEVLFKILERIGFGSIEKNYHLAYGYVYDKNGNKFSSRLGNTLGADDTLNLIIVGARKNLLSKEKTKDLPKEELDKRARIIGFSALAFNFLKVNPLDDMNFDIDKALSFEGETGPYLQYTYARIQSILNKTNYKANNKDKNDYSLFSDLEINLVKILKEYPKVLLEASNKYKVSHVANYLLKLSKSFNEFYQNSNIIKSEKELQKARLELCFLTSKVLKDALEIFGIETLDEM